MSENLPNIKKTAGQSAVAALGFWSALLTTVGLIGTWIGSIAAWRIAPQPFPWRGIEAYAKSFHAIQVVGFAPGLLLTTGFVTLMVSIHYYAPEDKKLLCHMGLAFAIVYAAMISVNYFLQLTLVRESILHGELAGVALLVSNNPRSVFWAVEMLGYGFMGLATLFIAPVFTAGKLERWIRWLLIVNGIMGVASPVVTMIDLDWVFTTAGLLSYVSWNVIFPLLTILLSAFFYQARRRSV